MARYPEAPMGYEPGDIPFDDPRSDEGDLSEREPEGRPGKKKKSRGEVRFFRMSAAIWSASNLRPSPDNGTTCRFLRSISSPSLSSGRSRIPPAKRVSY